jgi:serine kinase of HPr protein (carbohydrate metabolism regulator)
MPMNRFVKSAEANRTSTQNWFSRLPDKTQKEVLEAIEKWNGPAIVLADAIKSELKLTVSSKEVAARIRDVKKQRK